MSSGSGFRESQLLFALKLILHTHDVTCTGEDCHIGGIDLARAAIAHTARDDERDDLLEQMQQRLRDVAVMADRRDGTELTAYWRGAHDELENWITRVKRLEESR